MAPHLFDPYQVRVPKASDHLNRPDFLSGVRVVAAREELQGHDWPFLFFCFPDTAKTAPASQTAKSVSGANLLVNS
jgi:hypothetical protein